MEDERALVASMISRKKFGVLLRHAPYGNSYAQEALDETLAMRLFGQEMTHIFLGEGVVQLLKHQQTEGVRYIAV